MDEFKIDFSLIRLEDLITPYKDKFDLIGYSLIVSEVNDPDYFNFLRQHSYCRVALRDLPSDVVFFEINKNKISKDKNYHFILNGNYKGNNALINIYMLITIGNTNYKISFAKYNDNIAHGY